MADPSAVQLKATFNGPFLVGNLLNAALGGVACTLAIAYFVRFPYGKDCKSLFWTALALVGFNLAGMVTGFGTVWGIAIVMPGLIWVRVPKAFALTIILNGWTTFIVQQFYSYRVWVASGRQWMLPTAISILATVGIATNHADAFFCLLWSDTYAQLFARYRYTTIIWLSAAAGADVLITFSMYYYITHATKDLSSEHKSLQLSRLVRTTAETNVLTATIVLIDLILFAVNKPWHLAVNMAMPVLYFISFLVALLSRQWIRQLQPSNGARSLPPCACLEGAQHKSTMTGTGSVLVTTEELVIVESIASRQSNLSINGPRLLGTASADLERGVPPAKERWQM